MRYFLLGFVLVCVAVVGVLGFRGGTSRKPPFEIFPDMDRQAKLRPQTVDNVFPDGLSSQLPVAGTIARGSHFEDTPVNTGKAPGTTNFIESIPVPVTESLLARGQQRFQINCLPCHGASGDGKGITTKYGMTIVANLHDPRIVKLPDGDLFNTVTYGKGLMGAYGPNVPVEDRWAVIAYVRALQRSRLGDMNDVPPQIRSSIRK
jgi:mono/diheme cytochrome c family protein